MLRNYLSLIKFSHTIFALPFALVGFFIAWRQKTGDFDWFLLLKVLACMVFARSAAMAFNRWLDRDIDSRNPRTAVREIPAGVVSARAALVFVVVNCLAFVAAASFINPICGWLSPVALAVVLGYSFTKRFTWLCHFVLGVGLGLAPVGAYLAVAGHFSWIPILLGLAVLTWVAGFDIIYALQDEAFDRSQGLKSIPAFLGKSRALRLSEGLHLLTGGLILTVVYLLKLENLSLGWLHLAGTAVFLAMLFYQHTLVKTDDLSRVNLAFFTTNGVASVVFGGCLLLDLLI